MHSGGFGNPSIFPKNWLFCILKSQFFKNLRKILKIFWKKKFFFEKKFFCKNFFEKNFFVKKFWKPNLENFSKNRMFSSQILIYLWKSSIFPISEEPSAPRKYPSGGFGAPKRPFWCLRPPPFAEPPLQHLWLRSTKKQVNGSECFSWLYPFCLWQL